MGVKVRECTVTDCQSVRKIHKEDPVKTKVITEFASGIQVEFIRWSGKDLAVQVYSHKVCFSTQYSICVHAMNR